MNNIKYAKENASDEEVYNAARLSHCEEFINKLPNKYETLIGEDGVRLSGGEKQRISIARAMLKESTIILLDEATSSLDSETETKIQNALKVLTKNKTTIVIAHRLSTVLNSKNIYVVDNLNSDVTVFNSQGDYFKKAGYGSDSLKIMIDPCAVAVDKRGVVYVCDRGNSSIYRYQLSNNLDEDIQPED